MKQLQRRRWKYSFALLVSLSVGSLLTASSVFAYQEVTVTDGGTITGKVTLKGNKPAPRGFNLVIFPDPVYCGRISNGRGFRLLKEFTIAEDRGLKDVLVMLTGIQRGKPFDFPVTRIEARDCRFLPYINVLRGVGKVEVVNMDPVMHDIQAYETSQLGPRVLFNVPLPMNPQHPRDLKDRSDAALYHKHLAGEPMKQLVGMTKGRRVFVMQCGFHAYMESWGLAMENPYYALTDQDGRFEIGDITPGTYKMVIWHPYLGGTKEQTITIQPKSQAKMDIRIPAPTGRLYANEMVDKPYTRFGITDDAQSQIVPTLIRQER